jgi:hypothetical protein
MADDKPTSGSRWEPGADEETAPIAGPTPTEDATAAHEAVAPAEARPAKPGWRDRMASARGRVRGTRGVAVLVAAAALLVGGLGGFAVAQVVDDESGEGLHDAPGQGPLGDEHGDRHGGPGQGFGPGDRGRPGDSGTGGDGA